MKTDPTPRTLTGVRAAFHRTIAGEHPQHKNPVEAGDMEKLTSFFFSIAGLSRKAPRICVAHPMLIFGQERPRTCKELGRVPARCSKQRASHYKGYRSNEEQLRWF